MTILAVYSHRAGVELMGKCDRLERRVADAISLSTRYEISNYKGGNSYENDDRKANA